MDGMDEWGGSDGSDGLGAGLVGGDLLWVGGGHPVVSRCSTTGWGPSSLRDEEAGERAMVGMGEVGGIGRIGPDRTG